MLCGRNAGFLPGARSPFGRWPARLGVLAAGCGLSLILPAASASAHAVFVSASPAPGASLARPPAAIRIVFSEPLAGPLSGIRVIAPSGAAAAERHPGVDPSDPRAYQAGLPRLRPGGYTVVWHTTSAVDGHSRWGSYGFTVLLPGGRRPPGAPVPTAAAAAPSAGPAVGQAVASWLGLTGLFLLTGVVLMLLLGAVPGEEAGGLPREDGGSLPGEPVRRALARLLTAGAAACAAAVAGQAVASWAGAGWARAAVAAMLTQGVAHWWWLRLAAVAAVLVACHRRRRLVGARRMAAIAAVAALAVSFAGASHGAASASPAAGMVMMAVHVLAASVWLGGVLGLAICWALARRTGTPASALRELLRRFSVTAGMAVPAVAATGLASALLEIGRPGDLVSTGYGRVLLVKVTVAGLAGLAALASVRAHVTPGNRPRRAAGRQPPAGQPPRERAAGRPALGQRFRAGLWLEAGLGMAILLPAAALSLLPPPGPAEALRAAAQRIAAGSDPAASFTGNSRLGSRGIQLSLTPGGTGPNAIRAEVDGGMGAARLSLLLSGPHGAAATVALRRAGTDHDPRAHTLYTGAVSLRSAGDWQAMLRGPGGVSQPVVAPVRARAAGLAPAAGAGTRTGWLLVISVFGASATVLAATRGLRGRQWRATSIALGGAGCLAAAGWVGVLAIGPAAAAPLAPAAWGVTRPVVPLIAAHTAVWPFGGAQTGLMMPAVAPDGRVWIGEMGAGKLAVLSPASRTLRQVALPGGGDQEAMGVAVDRAGRVWVAEEHTQELAMFDPATGRYRQYRIPGDSPAPVGVAVDPGGSVWFTEMNGDAIGRLDPGTGQFTQFRLPTPGALPYWLAIAPDGSVWFSEFGAGKVGVLRPATGRLSEYPLPGRQNPTGIAIGPGGAPWLATAGGWLVRASPATGSLHRVRAPIADLYGVAVTGDGMVWLGTASGHALYAYRPASGSFRRYRLPAGQAPWWVAAAGRHRVWAALGGTGGLVQVAG